MSALISILLAGSSRPGQKLSLRNITTKAASR